jgi:hypothetical protein
MNKNGKWILLYLLLIVALAAGCGFDSNSGRGDIDGGIPDEVQEIMDKTTELAANYALQLNEEWADLYSSCLESGNGQNFESYLDLKSTLDQFRAESGAYRIYMLTDMDPADDCYKLTVDGSENPEPWMTRYEIEGAFLSAQDGLPIASLSARNDDQNDPIWSAYAPVYDSNNRIVGILAIDYPAPEILNFPKWNRDSDQWNGMEILY